MQEDCATLWRPRNKRNVRRCWLKGFTGLKLSATTPNNMQQHATGQCCVLAVPGWWPTAPYTFAPEWPENLTFFKIMQHTLGTLEFTGSEHWDPFNNIFLRARPYEGVQTDATRNIQQCWELTNSPLSTSNSCCWNVKREKKNTCACTVLLL